MQSSDSARARLSRLGSASFGGARARLRERPNLPEFVDYFRQTRAWKCWCSFCSPNRPVGKLKSECVISLWSRGEKRELPPLHLIVQEQLPIVMNSQIRDEVEIPQGTSAQKLPADIHAAPAYFD